MLTLCLSSGCGLLGVPSLGFHSWVWLWLMAWRRFAYPAGGPFLSRQKGTKERPGTSSLDPTRGFPLDLPEDGANAPYPLIPAGLLVDPLRGVYPLRLRLRGRRTAAGDGGVPLIQSWPAGHCPKGSFPTAVGNTEYGQLSGGRKRPGGRRWEQRVKVPSSPPTPEPIRRGRTRNR